MKATTFIIGLLMIGVITTSMSLLVINLSEDYSVSYDNTTMGVFENTEEIKALAVRLDNETSTQTTDSGIFDIVGNFIGRAVSVLRISQESVTTFKDMAEDGTKQVGLPSYFLDFILASITVLFVLGIIVSAMIKKDI